MISRARVNKIAPFLNFYVTNNRSVQVRDHEAEENWRSGCRSVNLLACQYQTTSVHLPYKLLSSQQDELCTSNMAAIMTVRQS